ncbi:hypothetical protein OAT67_04890 [Bacteriovoracaceae bacterium]|nr:hypothetical protein [Bacteriovoracaceae bacterium]
MPLFIEYIDNFSSKEASQKWLLSYSQRYKLSKGSLEQQYKNILAESYDFKQSHFLNRFSKNKIPKYIFQYFSYLIYTLLFSKSYSKSKAREFELLIDGVENELEVKRFSHLIEKFSSTAIISTSPISMKGYDIFHHSKRKGYSRAILLKVIMKELFQGFFFHLYYSFKAKVNLFPIACRMLEQYLYYSTIFNHIAIGKFLIQERHYNTNSIRNDLFKKYGGKLVTTIQKNIIFSGHTGFYYDYDVFFSLGRKTAYRVFRQGGKIGKVVPVGSKFMEFYCSNRNDQASELQNKYDIIYYGLNLVFFHNCYSKYEEDYYEHFKWLAKFSIKHPHYKVGIKHHPNNTQDLKEKEIIKDSKVERIDQRLNSYNLGLNPRICNVSYGSTIGFEFIGEGYQCIFMDPGNRNHGFLPEEDSFNHWRATNYEEFELKVLEVLNNSNCKPDGHSSEDYCMKSDNVSEGIYNYLMNMEMES